MEDPGISAEMQYFLQTCRKWEISEKNSLRPARVTVQKKITIFFYSSSVTCEKCLVQKADIQSYTQN